MSEDWETQWNRLWADIPIWWKILWKGYSQLLAGVSLNSPRIIELGCGSGRTSMALAEKYKGSVTLVDNSLSALKKAKQTFRNSNIPVKYIKADLFSLKLNEEFDLVHSEGLIEHFNKEELNYLVSLHKNLCAKKGFAIIFVPTPSRTYKIWRFIQEKLGMWYYGDEKPMTVYSLKKICESNSLKVLKEVHTPFQVGVLCKRKI
ncbi:MAG: class I SAM-dependent methyltransferase [Candidatus Odinarchaeia archaeon]